MNPKCFEYTIIPKCDLHSCQYNTDGRCGYKEATIKNPNACACHYEFEDNNIEEE